MHYGDTDVNECLEFNGGCHKDRKCVNSEGGMKCGDCSAGLANAGDKGCTGLRLLLL